MPEDQQQPAASTPTPPNPTPVALPQQQPSTTIQPTNQQPTELVQPQPTAPVQPAAVATPPAPQPLQQPAQQAPPQQMTSAPVAPAAPAATAPVQPQAAAPISASMQEKSGGSKKIAMIIGIVLAAAIILGVAAFAAVTLLGGSDTISKSDLVSDSYSGVSFERPEQWLETDYEEGKAYVLEGQDADTADQGLLVLSQDIGVDYSQLNDQQKQLLSDGFQEELSNQSSLEDDGCTEVTDFSAVTTEQEGYDVAFLVDATCSEFQGSEQEGRLKYIIGISGSQLHGVSVIGLTDLWDTSAEAMETVLRSMSPTL